MGSPGKELEVLTARPSLCLKFIALLQCFGVYLCVYLFILNFLSIGQLECNYQCKQNFIFLYKVHYAIMAANTDKL